MSNDGNVLKNGSSDHKYFVIIPQIVWARCKDPYDLALWFVIKMIAGDDGECYLSRDDLAALAMMSTGKVSECRQRLLDAGLLEGKIKRDPGYPQPVWHLRIPDLWRDNLRWREQLGDELRARIDLKRTQNEARRERRKRRHQVTPIEPSPGDGGMSPGDGGMSPGDGGMSPGDAKDIHNRTQKENQPTPNNNSDAAGDRERSHNEGQAVVDAGGGVSLSSQKVLPLTDEQRGVRDLLIEHYAVQRDRAEEMARFPSWFVLWWCQDADQKNLDNPGGYLVKNVLSGKPPTDRKQPAITGFLMNHNKLDEAEAEELSIWTSENDLREWADLHNHEYASILDWLRGRRAEVISAHRD